MTGDPYTVAATGAGAIRERLGEHDVAVVLGSGWAGVVPLLGEERARTPMPDLPGFPAPAVQGHTGMAHSLDVARVPVLVMAGRSHLYEGHPASTVVHGVRSAVLSGCRAVLLTNAAGSLVPANGPGTPVVLRDQLNLMGVNPMSGADPPVGFPARFADLTDLYSPRLRAAAAEARPGIAEGVYAGLLGGSYETPAEIAMLRAAGADAVGMSTVLEALAGRAAGMRVAAISLIANPAAGLTSELLAHEAVVAAGAAAEERMAALLREALPRLSARCS